MEKSPEAFRTISEVAEWLDVPTHVLRFWESRFSQIKPVKRAGGRRYYRPADMRLIGGIKVLLHDEGLTIRGAQKMLREKGIRHIGEYSPPLPGMVGDDAESAIIEHTPAQADDEASTETVAHAATPEAPPTTDVEPVPPEAPAAEAEPAQDVTPVFRERVRTRRSPADRAQIDLFAPPSDLPADPTEEDDRAPAAPGIPARIWGIGPARLARHRDVVAQVADRLRAMRSERFDRPDD